MLRRAALAVAVALMVAGCNGDPAGPAPSPTTTNSTSRPTDVPPVADPIDLRSVYEHPCAMLTTAQQNELGLRPRVEESAGDGTGTCKWASEDTAPLYVYLLRLNLRSDLLVDAYGRRDARDPDGDPIWALFEPREIGGLPAVTRAFSTTGDHCEVIVDVGNGENIAIAGSLETEPDPQLCDRLVTAAGWVVDSARK